MQTSLTLTLNVSRPIILPIYISFLTLVDVAFLSKSHTARNFQQQFDVNGHDRIDYEVSAAIGILKESTKLKLESKLWQYNIINLSSCALSDIENNILSRGLGFGIPPVARIGEAKAEFKVFHKLVPFHKNCRGEAVDEGSLTEHVRSVTQMAPNDNGSTNKRPTQSIQVRPLRD